MGKGDAYIKVWCDYPDCNYEEEIGLISLAMKDCWDERNVDKRLIRLGWTVRGEKQYCNEHDEKEIVALPEED